MSDPVDRVGDLLRRALDPGATLEEARTSAVRACETIRKNDLIVVPRQEYDRLIETAQALVADVAALRKEIRTASASAAPAPPASLGERVRRGLGDLESLAKVATRTVRSLRRFGEETAATRRR